jgi:hypothetical protein
LKYFYTFGLSLGEASLISEVYFLQAASTKHFLDKVTYYFLRLFKVFNWFQMTVFHDRISVLNSLLVSSGVNFFVSLTNFLKSIG